MAFSRAVKAAAMADLAAGMGPTEVSVKHGINYRTVIHWSSELPLTVATKHETFATKKEAIGDLIIDLLDTNLRVAKKLLETVADDKEWIKSQSASDLGVFYGIITDKSATIASILTAAAQPQPQLPAPTQEVDPYSDTNVSGVISQDTD